MSVCLQAMMIRLSFMPHINQLIQAEIKFKLGFYLRIKSLDLLRFDLTFKVKKKCFKNFNLHDNNNDNKNDIKKQMKG